MIAFREEKIKNAICFFAYEHYKRTKKPLWQTLLYKYLGFLDFKSIKEKGRPVLGLRFSAYPKGPVPLEINSKREEFVNEFFAFVNTGGNYYQVISKKKPNLDYFSKYEINTMKKLIERYSRENKSNKDMIDLAINDSHKIPAWKKARKRDYKKMLYEDMFSNIHNKKEEELTPEEENFLIFEGLRKKSDDNRRCLHME